MRKLSILFLFPGLLIMTLACQPDREISLKERVIKDEKPRIHKLAERYLTMESVTVTDSVCSRSAGGKHDFYSEGDYWWPDPDNPDGPYIRKDGMSNPGNFKADRRAMVRLSRIVGALTSEWLLTRDTIYSSKAFEHLQAWFVDTATMMNPNLLFSQAIKGRYTGRGIGIIDALHLTEVARSAYLLQKAHGIPQDQMDSVKHWFGSLLNWMMTHDYGKKEMIHPNNHSTCWFVQAAAYAQLTGYDSVLRFCRDRYEKVLLPDQMGKDGSFPLELNRTKPYGYSLFNLDAMSLLVQILTTSGFEDVRAYQTVDGKSIKKGMEFMFSYMKDKSSWPYKPDVMYWEYWPVSQPALVLNGLAFNNPEYISLWEKLEHDPDVEEVQRNLVMRYPILWLDINK